MDMSIVYVAAILFAAAYLQSATGFGLALVCMALVPFVLPEGGILHRLHGLESASVVLY